MSKIYIAASWRNCHLVEMLTAELRKMGHEVKSFVENDFGENPSAPGNDISKTIDWIDSDLGLKAFEYDTDGALNSDLVIYAGGGKDAAAELGMAYAKGVPILGLWSKVEDFGLMRRMVWGWFNRYQELPCAG